MWNGKGPFGRPDHIIRDAHEPDTDTSCVNFSLDGHTMITRGGDHTLKGTSTFIVICDVKLRMLQYGMCET